MKVVVTRPNTEVRICCLRQAICREPESDDFSYREDYHLLYEADCDGDGIYEKICQTGDLIHVYEKPGIYTIAMRGNVGHILLRDAKHGNLELSEISNYAPDADDYCMAFDGLYVCWCVYDSISCYGCTGSVPCRNDGMYVL